MLLHAQPIGTHHSAIPTQNHVNFVDEKCAVVGEEGHTFCRHADTARVDVHLEWRGDVDSGEDRGVVGADEVDHIVVVAPDDDVT